VTEPAHLAQQSLSTEAARLLANTTKSAPQYIGSSHRWLVPFLPWRALEAGTFRINRLRVTAPPARLVAVVDQEPAYARIDAPADRAEKAVLGKLSPEQVTATGLAGEPITARMTSAPGNGASLGGVGLVRGGAVRHRGVHKIYAESFSGPEHLKMIQEQAQDTVSAVIDG
jgi:hypothetical protein